MKKKRSNSPSKRNSFRHSMLLVVMVFTSFFLFSQCIYIPEECRLSLICLSCFENTGFQSFSSFICLVFGFFSSSLARCCLQYVRSSSEMVCVCVCRYMSFHLWSIWTMFFGNELDKNTVPIKPTRKRSFFIKSF